MSNQRPSRPVIDRTGRMMTALPLSARTMAHNTNSPSFHVMKLPALSQMVEHLHLVAEYCIQPYTTVAIQAVWWTSYVVLARPGTLTKGSGVYTEWNEFGTIPSTRPIGIIAPQTSGILIADMSKGVLNGGGSSGLQANDTILRQVNLTEFSNDGLEIFAVLVATGMHDGGYLVNGQAWLEFRTRT